MLQEPKHPTDSCQVTPFSQPQGRESGGGTASPGPRSQNFQGEDSEGRSPKPGRRCCRGPESQHQKKQSGCFPSQQISVLRTLQFTPHIFSIPSTGYQRPRPYSPRPMGVLDPISDLQPSPLHLIPARRCPGLYCVFPKWQGRSQSSRRRLLNVCKPKKIGQERSFSKTHVQHGITEKVKLAAISLRCFLL